MISNIVISRLESVGFKLYKQLHLVSDKILLRAILEKSIQHNTPSHDSFFIKVKRKFLYSSTFTYQDLPTERPNLYGLHILANYDLIGLRNVIIYLSKQFQQYGLHQIDSDQLEFISQGLTYHKDSIQITLNGAPISVVLDWQGKNNSGAIYNI